VLDDAVKRLVLTVNPAVLKLPAELNVIIDVVPIPPVYQANPPLETLKRPVVEL